MVIKCYSQFTNSNSIEYDLKMIFYAVSPPTCFAEACMKCRYKSRCCFDKKQKNTTVLNMFLILPWFWEDQQIASCSFLSCISTLRPRQHGRHFPDDIFKWIFRNENVWILLKISLKFAPKGWINNIPALVQLMACHRPGDKPISEPMMVNLQTHICVTGPQWVRWIKR